MIAEFFGLPGSGKSSFLVYIAIQTQSSILRGKSQYDRVVSNVEIDYPGIVYMTFSDMLRFDLGWNTLCVIDEASLEFDNRDFKNFSYAKLDYFVQHRRYKYDILIFTQKWDAVDCKVRALTDRVYYVHTGTIFKSLSYATPIDYGIHVPSKRDKNSPSYGEIVQGYYKAPLLQRVFSRRIYRPEIYDRYNSYIHPQGKSPLSRYLRAHGYSEFDVDLITSVKVK